MFGGGAQVVRPEGLPARPTILRLERAVACPHAKGIPKAGGGGEPPTYQPFLSRNFLPAEVLKYLSRFLASARVPQISSCTRTNGLREEVDLTLPLLC